MIAPILYAYNLASPRTKSAARAGAAFLAGAALAVLATACSPAYAGAANRGTIRTKPNCSLSKRIRSMITPYTINAR